MKRSTSLPIAAVLVAALAAVPAAMVAQTQTQAQPAQTQTTAQPAQTTTQPQAQPAPAQPQQHLSVWQRMKQAAQQDMQNATQQGTQGVQNGVQGVTNGVQQGTQTLQQGAQQATSGSAGTTAFSGSSGSSGACGPNCYNAGPFVANVSQMTMSQQGAWHIIRMNIQFHNATNQPLVIAYQDGSMVMTDNNGATYQGAGGNPGELQGMGIDRGASTDAQFVLGPGQTSSATFSVARGRPANSPIGTNYAYNLTIDELQTQNGATAIPVRSYNINFANLSPGSASSLTSFGNSFTGGSTVMSSAPTTSTVPATTTTGTSTAVPTTAVATGTTSTTAKPAVATTTTTTAAKPATTTTTTTAKPAVALAQPATKTVTTTTVVKPATATSTTVVKKTTTTTVTH